MLEKLKSKKGIIIVVVLLLIVIGACSDEDVEEDKKEKVEVEEVDDGLRKELHPDEERLLKKDYIDFTDRERKLFDTLEKGNTISENLKKDIKNDVERLSKEKEVVLKDEKLQAEKDMEEYKKRQAKKEKERDEEDKKGVVKEEKAPSNNYKLKFGELVDVVINDDVAIFKAKIKPSYNNKATINQNGFNIEDLIKEQGADKFKEIQYWAVAEMTDGSESKAISFTVNSNTIKSIKDGRIVGYKVIDHVDDLWLLPSLRD